MNQKIAGVYFHSGKTSQFIACVLEYFSPGKRWVVDKIHFSNDGAKGFGESFEGWVKENKISDLVLNFPTTGTICDSCELVCPGEENCSHPVIKEMKNVSHEFLRQDTIFEKESPKDYERERNKQNEYDHHRTPFSRSETGKKVPLSKSLKKRLRRGFIPYWNRPIDLYIWLNYYDELIQVFNYSYDSFGHSSLMNIKRFHYLSKHLFGVNILEANIYVNFLELLKAGYLSPEDLFGMKYVDEFSVSLRKNIVTKIEQNLNIYIKNEDSAMLTFDPRAINAFILSLSGIASLDDKTLTLPHWCRENNSNFIVPVYS